MANFAGFIGPSYQGRAFQADAEESMNWYPEAVESPGGRTKTTYTLLSKPGFAVFANLSTPDFTIEVTPFLQVLGGPGTTHFTITITPQAGFTGSVTLSAVASPSSGISFGFSPNPVTGGSGTSDLTVTVAGIPVGGVYNITVTGTSGSLTHSVPCQISFLV